MTTLTFTAKADLIAALEATRPHWRKVDAAATKEHRAKEKAALAEFRARCKKAMGMTYDQLKNDVDQWGDRGRYSRLTLDDPSCPMSKIGDLDAMLGRLNLTGQERFTIESTGRWADVWKALTGPIDAAARKDVCS